MHCHYWLLKRAVHTENHKQPVNTRICRHGAYVRPSRVIFSPKPANTCTNQGTAMTTRVQESKPVIAAPRTCGHTRVCLSPTYSRNHPHTILKPPSGNPCRPAGLREDSNLNVSTRSRYLRHPLHHGRHPAAEFLDVESLLAHAFLWSSGVQLICMPPNLPGRYDAWMSFGRSVAQLNTKCRMVWRP